MQFRVPRTLTTLCVVVAATSCGDRESTSVTPAAPSTPPPTLRISGIPPSLSPGQSIQLTAELVAADGGVSACAAGWAVDDSRVATVSPAGLLTGGMTGYARAAATCQGISASAEIKTSAPSPYQWIIVAHDSDVPSEFGVAATVEFLEGPRRGERIPIGSVFTNGTPGTEWPVRVRLTASDYADTETVLAETTGKRRNSNSPLFDFQIPMRFVADASTDTYVRQMSRTEMEIAHPFEPRSSGTVQIRTWWSVDYNDVLHVDLWCDGERLAGVAQRFGSAGHGLSHPVNAPARCEVRLRQSKSDAATRYRIAIRYPH
jgi:hypothetical protein